MRRNWPGRRRRRFRPIVSSCFRREPPDWVAFPSRCRRRPDKFCPRSDCWTTEGRAVADRSATMAAPFRWIRQLGFLLDLSTMSSSWKRRRQPQLQRPRSVAGRCANAVNAANCWPARPDCPIRKRTEPTGVGGGRLTAEVTSATTVPTCNQMNFGQSPKMDGRYFVDDLPRPKGLVCVGSQSGCSQPISPAGSGSRRGRRIRRSGSVMEMCQMGQSRGVEKRRRHRRLNGLVYRRSANLFRVLC